VLKATRAIFWGPGPSEAVHDLHDARRTEWGALVLLGASLVILGVWPRLILDPIDPGSAMYLPRLLTASVR
ncbi:MAG: hypothetical protein ACHREM_05975, partial [Polyangiales bacterium]